MVLLEALMRVAFHLSLAASSAIFYPCTCNNEQTRGFQVKSRLVDEKNVDMTSSVVAHAILFLFSVPGLQ